MSIASPSWSARPMERVLGPQMGDFVRPLQKSVVWFSIFKIPFDWLNVCPTPHKLVRWS